MHTREKEKEEELTLTWRSQSYIHLEVLYRVATLTTPPISPGVGARRRGPKSLPTLPLSAFSPPDTGISDSFPLPQSPTTVHPERVVDANVRCSIPE